MITFRPFERTESDYEAILNVHNSAWPDDLTTLAQMKFRDENRQPKYKYSRVVCEKNGALVAMGSWGHMAWSHRPGKFFMDWDILPELEDVIRPILFAEVYSQIEAENPDTIMGFARDDKTTRVAFLEEHGFAVEMRYPVSQLVVADFDFSAYEGLANYIDGLGLDVYTFAEIREREANWLAKIEEFDWAIAQDIPSPEPLTREPLEVFAKNFESPGFIPEAYFIATTRTDDGSIGDYVSHSMLTANPDQREKMYTGITGTLPEWRRKGIATFLKLQAINWAKKEGFELIETDNEENNPMYDLNLQLGFKPRPAWLDFKKAVKEVREVGVDGLHLR